MIYNNRLLLILLIFLNSINLYSTLIYHTLYKPVLFIIQYTNYLIYGAFLIIANQLKDSRHSSIDFDWPGIVLQRSI